MPPLRSKVVFHLEFLRGRRHAPGMEKAATADALANAPPYAVEHRRLLTPAWPQRPDGTILNETIPLFFVARDKDGFWIARNADVAIGGKFFLKYSALRFAGYYNASAIMMLTEVYSLDTRNTGNRFARQLRPTRRLLRDIASKFNALFAGTVKR